MTPVGVLLGALTIDQARQLVALCDAFGTQLGITFDETGQTAHITGDVAAVLDAA